MQKRSNKHVQIKVNTFNRLKKIRMGVVYDSITTIIDELLQNCQRSFIVSSEKIKSNVPTIDVVAEEATLIIRDNGNGCSDPQDIFEFEKSGWNISDAFGQGGSESIFQIADFISIRSQKWKAWVDVLEMLGTENLNVRVEDSDEYFSGYEILMNGNTIKDNMPLLVEYLKEQLSRLECECYLNGAIIEKKNIHEFESEYTQVFENRFYKATLGVQTGYRDIQIYYEKRKVCDIWMQGVYGIIELNRDAVHLKAPDRKSIIRDSKYYDFYKILSHDCKLLYIEFVKTCTDEQFDKYETGIDKNLEPIDYEEYLPLYDTDSRNAKKQQSLSVEVPNSATVKERDALDNINAESSKSRYTSGASGYYDKGGIKSNDNIVIRKKGTFKEHLGKILNTVWCEFHRKDELQEYINKAEDHSLTILYSKGKLYSKTFEYWGIPHIEKVFNKSEARYVIGSSGRFIPGDTERYERTSSRKEERLLYLLSKIESFYGLHDVFRIADVKEHLSIEHNGEIIMDTMIKTSAAPMKERKKIYLDRSSLNLGKINISESKSKVTKFDVLVIMLNIQTISSGLAQILYNTVEKTVDHITKTEKIGKEIALILASL